MPPRSRPLRATILSSALFAVALPTAAQADTTIQAESLKLRPAKAGHVMRSKHAGGDEVLRIRAVGTAVGAVKLDEAGSGLVVRARARRCHGSPHMTVTVDGVRRLAVRVGSRRYRDYAATFALAAGTHVLKIRSENAGRSHGCRRALYLDSLTVSSAAATNPAPAAPAPAASAPGAGAGGTGTAAIPAADVFATNYGVSGLAPFFFTIHSNRIAVVDDPVLGGARKVLKFQVFPSDTGPTENPRAQLETPYDFKEGDERYIGVSYLFPADFPTSLPSQGWISMGDLIYGPPYGGAAPLTLRVQNHVGGGGTEIRWQRNQSYNYDIPWVGPMVSSVRGRWLDFVVHIKLHHDPHVGFVEIWMNTGSGWVQQKLAGGPRLYMSTYDATNNGGANNSRLALYYRNDTPGPLTMFGGPVRIASAGPNGFAAVAPHSYG